MSELDNARAALQPFMFVVGFIDAIERFEAAVRANERSGATRAAVLREATAEVERDPMGCVPRLRRMADAAEQP